MSRKVSLKDHPVRPCTKCGVPTVFAPTLKGRRNRDSMCKPCKAAWEREWRKSSPTIRARELARWHARKSDPKEMEKLKARKATRRAISDGSLTKGPCEVCGRAIAEAHHDDYGKPLDVRWLCPHHHRQHHLSVSPEARSAGAHMNRDGSLRSRRTLDAQNRIGRKIEVEMSKLKGDPGYRDGWCIHYRSPSGPGGRKNTTCCEAGVEYSNFAGGFHRQPCFLDKGKSKPDALPCERLRLPTSEEIAAHEQWLNARMDNMRTVMLGIRPWREKHKGRSHGEVIECPACTGRLHLSIAAYNGHVHGRCETDGCVSWME